MAASSKKQKAVPRVPVARPAEEIHEGHHYIAIIFLFAVLVTIVFLIPPAIVPIPKVSLPFQHANESVAPIFATPPENVQEQIDYESLFQRNAYALNRPHDFGLFKTKLLRIGFYAYYDNLSKKDEVKFRADIWAKNVGTASENFSTANGFLRATPNMYKVSGGNFNDKDFAPGEARSGYILFDNVPRDLNGNIGIAIGTAVSYNIITGTQAAFPFLYEMVYPPA